MGDRDRVASPWHIALPNAQYRTIARFCHRQDAEDHLRVLQRFIPKADFAIVFDSEDSDLVPREASSLIS